MPIKRVPIPQEQAQAAATAKINYSENMGSISNENMQPEPEVAKGDAYLSALLLCASRIFPAVLNAAVDLNLFDIIAKASNSCGGNYISATEIASQLPNQHPELVQRLERMLTLLASFSLLTVSIHANEDGESERVYALSPIGEYLACDDDHEGSLAPYPALLHRGFDETWKDFKDAIVDPHRNHFEKVHGMPLYKYMEKNEKLNDLFNKSMANLCTMDMNLVLKVYKGFEGISTLVDIGGGTGQNLKLIISKYPSTKGINFDLPPVAQNAPPHPGIEHVGGDMYESVPMGDAIMLRAVCHNWSDEKCIELLKNCHKALPQDGKVIVVDFIMPEAPSCSSVSKLASMVDNLMLVTTGGKERTEKEFERLCMSSGFSRFHVACCAVSAMDVMEFYK